MIIDFTVDHRVGIESTVEFPRIEPAVVEAPSDRDRGTELVVPPPPSWHAPAPQPQLDRR